MGALGLASEILAHHSVLGDGHVNMVLEGWRTQVPPHAEVHVFPPSQSTDQAGREGCSSMPGLHHGCCVWRMAPAHGILPM